MTTVHADSISKGWRRLQASFPLEKQAGALIDLISTSRAFVAQWLAPGLNEGDRRVAVREFLVLNDENPRGPAKDDRYSDRGAVGR